MLCTLNNMSTATVRELRLNYGAVERKLRRGTVTLMKKGRAVADIVPRSAWTPPDFLRRALQDTGGRYRRRDLLAGIER